MRNPEPYFTKLEMMSTVEAAIEEDGIYAQTDLAAVGGGDSGAVSQTPTPTTDSSRRSSQISLAVSEGETAAMSMVPKQSRAAATKSGARQLVEKRRKALDRPKGAAERSAGDRRSIFTLDHVRRMFGPQQEQPQQQPSQQQQQQRRRSSGTGDGIELHRRLSRLSVDSLPAVFLAKCLGEAPADGLFGVDCVREPVAALVKAAGKRKAKSGRPLPIAQLTVLPQGVSVRPHPQSEGGQVAKAFHAIDSVSYAVVDTQVERIFCLVTVATGAQPACRAFLCDSPDTAHRLVLAVTLAFEASTNFVAAAEDGGVDDGALGDPMQA